MGETSKKPTSTHNQSGPAYKVEVRATSRPVQLGDQLVGNEWVPLPTVDGKWLGTSYRDAADVLTYTHNYYGAIALAASVLSSTRMDELEARVVEFHRSISYELTRGDEMPLPGFVDRMFADAERGAAKRQSESV